MPLTKELNNTVFQLEEQNENVKSVLIGANSMGISIYHDTHFKDAIDILQEINRYGILMNIDFHLDRDYTTFWWIPDEEENC